MAVWFPIFTWDASTTTVLLLPSISTLIMFPIAVAWPPVVVPDQDGIIGVALVNDPTLSEGLAPPPDSTTRLACASELKPRGRCDHPDGSMLI